MFTDRDWISFAAFGDTERWQAERRNASLAQDLGATLAIVLGVVILLSMMG